MSQMMSDEDFARQLQRELSRKSTRTRRKSSRSRQSQYSVDITDHLDALKPISKPKANRRARRPARVKRKSKTSPRSSPNTSVNLSPSSPQSSEYDFNPTPVYVNPVPQSLRSLLTPDDQLSSLIRADAICDRVFQINRVLKRQQKYGIGPPRQLGDGKERLPPLLLLRSPIHAFGVFAAAHIPSDRLVAEYTGELIDMGVADSRERAADRSGFASTYLFHTRMEASGSGSGRDCVIDATFSGNWARYVNHSCAANARSVTLPDGRVELRTTRDIVAGEEICYDYKLQRNKGEDPIPCCCGSATCRKWLTLDVPKDQDIVYAELLLSAATKSKNEDINESLTVKSPLKETQDETAVKIDQ